MHQERPYTRPEKKYQEISKGNPINYAMLSDNRIKFKINYIKKIFKFPQYLKIKSHSSK